jgi:hypothetical protein
MRRRVVSQILLTFRKTILLLYYPQIYSVDKKIYVPTGSDNSYVIPYSLVDRY